MKRLLQKDHWALVNHLFNKNTWEEVEQKIDALQEKSNSYIRHLFSVTQIYEK